jgi:hypothetical protein
VTIRDGSDDPTAGKAGETSERPIAEWSPAGGLFRRLCYDGRRHRPALPATPGAALADLLTISARISGYAKRQDADCACIARAIGVV